MSTIPMSENLIKTWNFIYSFQEMHGFSPKLEQISEALNLRSKRGASIQLEKLEKLGIIQREKNARRAIKVLVVPTTEVVGASDLINVPVLGEVIAGEPVFAEQNIKGYMDISLAESKGRRNVFLLEVKGNSMNKAGFNPGDYAIVTPQTVAENGDVVVAFDPNNETATLKKFKKVDNYILLIPESTDPTYKPFIGDSFVVQGKVLGRIDQRNAKMISVN